MAKRYTMIATQNGTTTVTWDNDDAPDGTGSGPNAPGGTLTQIRVLSVSDYDKPFVEEGGESWRNLSSALMPGTLVAQWNFDGDHTDSSGNSLDMTPKNTEVAATGQVNLPAGGGGSVGINSPLIIDDGYNGSVEFRFVTSAGSPTSHARRIVLTLSETQAQLTTKLYDEIVASPLDLTPVDNGTNVGLTNNRIGTDGNITITNSISGVSVSGMSGGIGKLQRYPVRQGIQGWETAQGVDYEFQRASYDAALGITGAMSIWTIVRVDQVPTGDARFAVFSGPSDVEADNYLYALYLQANSTQLRYFCEHQAGVNNTAYAQLRMSLGQMSLLSMSRDASGNVTFFLNGDSSGPHDCAIPTGGTGGQFQFPDNNVLITGFYGCLAITNATHDVNDHLAMYDYVRSL